MIDDPFGDELSGAEEEPQVEMLPVEGWPPPHAELVCEFVVIGEAKPAGSKTSGVAYRKDKRTGKPVPVKRNGKIATFTKDSSGAAGKSWRNDVSAAGMNARSFDEPLDGRLAMEVVFVMPYKPTDYSKRDGRLKESVRAAPHVRPDVLKLTRAVEDALATVLYTDDARITEERLRKVHVAKDRGPRRAEVRLWRLPTTVGELRAAGLGRYGPDGQESLIPAA